MVRMGWYREVQVKSLAAHERMALLGVRRPDPSPSYQLRIRGDAVLAGTAG
jgi:hypothetical protein